MADRCGSPWLTRSEAARYCRCGERRIESAVRCGEIPSYRPKGSEDPRRYIVHKDDLDTWVRSGLREWPVAEALKRAGKSPAEMVLREAIA